MEIIFHGKHDSDEAVANLASIIRLFKDRYHIEQFREMHLSLTLVDDEGQDVELIDSDTEQAYRLLEVVCGTQKVARTQARPALKLVIDNVAHSENRS